MMGFMVGLVVGLMVGLVMVSLVVVSLMVGLMPSLGLMGMRLVLFYLGSRVRLPLLKPSILYVAR